MNPNSNKTRYGVFAVSMGCLIFVLAYLNRATFPFPVNDEARFYLPALWWAEHFSLSPASLNAPHGIFWVPDGFTILIGLALCCFGKTIQVARGVCEVSVAFGVTLFALAFRKLGESLHAGLLTTLLLLTPPVIFAANMVRMEALLFLLIAMALLLHAYGHVVSALSLLAGSLLFHPALGMAAVGYAGAVFLLSRTGRPNVRVAKFEWAIAAIVAILISAELFRIVHHWSLFEAHMTYQAKRKLHAPLRTKLMKPQGLILLCSSLTVITLFRRGYAWLTTGCVRDLLPVAVVVLGILSYTVVGNEVAYDVYSLSVCPALLFCLVWRVNDIRSKSIEDG